MFWKAVLPLLSATLALAAVSTKDSNSTVILSSDRLSIEVNKTTGSMTDLTFDGIDIIGTGRGYYDCFCIPAANTSVWSPSNPNPASSRNYNAGKSGNATFQTLQGTSSNGQGWVGLIMSETYVPTGQQFYQYWFLRDGESGWHSFTRLRFDNGTKGVDLGTIQELRQVITPVTSLWTQLVTNERQYATLPSKAAIANQVTVQDATWYYNVTEGNPYKTESSDYFTKYQYADQYGDHLAHGFYADGSTSNGTQLGFWMVLNNYEGFSGGPLRSDLVVDTNLYNYYLSNHRGSSLFNLTSGFDRVFGPSFVYLNRDGDLQSLHKDAKSKGTPSFSAEFYDEIAQYVPGYTPSSGRGDFNAKVSLPEGAYNGKAVLSEVGRDFQDNVGNGSVSQYWANISSDGTVNIPRVRANTYRLTVYADGIFGQYEQDGITVAAGDGKGAPLQVTWRAEKHGAELWRLGVPDKTAGEFRHGFARDQNHTLHQEEYRQYWGAYDFPTDFPSGVNYTIGRSDPSRDWNYVHYSRYGGTYRRPGFVLDNINVWTVNYAPTSQLSTAGKNATLTVQLAGARTASGNLDAPEPTSNYSNLDFTINVNGGNNNLVWTIRSNESSSCSDRSGITCYSLRKVWSFPAEWLKNGTGQNNVFQFILPYNASGGDVNFRNYSVSVMYDAIRLELGQ